MHVYVPFIEGFDTNVKRCVICGWFCSQVLVLGSARKTRQQGLHTRTIRRDDAIDGAIRPANIALRVLQQGGVGLLVTQGSEDVVLEHRRSMLRVLAGDDVERALASGFACA